MRHVHQRLILPNCLLFFQWKLSYEPSQDAYTIQQTKSGLFVSFEGSAKENAHLGAHAKPKYFAIEQQSEKTYRYVYQNASSWMY